MLGVALVVGRWLTVVAVALTAHLSGTFLVLLVEPHVPFQHGNPMLLTTEGEFVVKNLVLISAAGDRLNIMPCQPALHVIAPRSHS